MIFSVSQHDASSLYMYKVHTPANLMVKAGTHEAGHSDLVSYSDWFGVLLTFPLLWSQRLVSQAVHAMRLVAETV